jgi:hypothetical protein
MYIHENIIIIKKKIISIFLQPLRLTKLISISNFTFGFYLLFLHLIHSLITTFRCIFKEKPSRFCFKIKKSKFISVEND